ncbi:hypothetical protein KC343_g8351 [Hortaea werneckii]|uniref:Uncharacterized protein n=1 Tax=Hortaea werneckii TaxID=91943 RepID=A0A3M7FRF2_HORWE|nr:hypothetical protein KC352_g40903 [Hortaea werneckii]KAI7561851.1 hypothetical protein KC317_g8805 [Hortaea werneckii]KAI7611117.1 hypothetical protein KC346_g8449 [Hortaea werneckii]KAI7620544.1 hypothetical protein KC343_g8351 [Hortaea werneckii]KAI7643550.1 hypothetical protein KC322_g19871 [Hortaea werneckii]
MPPKRASTKGKEPKETVVYAASKRKAPPFKPQRPGKLPRPTSESESSSKAATSQRELRPQVIDEEEGEEENEKDIVESAGPNAVAGENDSNDSGDSEEELAADPLAAKPKTKPTARSILPPKPAPAASKRKKPARPKSPVPISDDNFSPRSSPPAGGEQPPAPSQSSETPGVPQNLLVRLLHENLRDKKTQIDKNAIQVLDKYIEVFVREAIARTSLSKQERAASGEILADDARWLELEDLERVAPGLVLDF